MATMKKLLLALLAVAAVAVVSVVVIMENIPERRMDRKFDRLLRSYEDDPKQLYQRVVDDRDLLGFVLVSSFLAYNVKQHQELFDDFYRQIQTELCDCETAPPLLISGIIRDEDFVLPVFPRHPVDCNYARVSRDIEKTWAPYIRRKSKEFREAQLTR